MQCSDCEHVDEAHDRFGCIISGCACRNRSDEPSLASWMTAFYAKRSAQKAFPAFLRVQESHDRGWQVDPGPFEAIRQAITDGLDGHSEMSGSDREWRRIPLRVYRRELETRRWLQRLERR